jgi:hypothetical protein
MKTLTLKHALKLSIAKWQHIVENNGDDWSLLEELPELKDLICECGLCEKYSQKSRGKFNHCYGCPLIIMSDNYNYEKQGCVQDNHPFSNWASNQTKENAQKLLTALKIILIKDENKRKRIKKQEIIERWKKFLELDELDNNAKYFLYRK